MFGPKRAGHMFCATCGVSLFNFIQVPGVPLAPVNVRTLNGVDVDKMPSDEREIVVGKKDGEWVVTMKEPEPKGAGE